MKQYCPVYFLSLWLIINLASSVSGYPYRSFSEPRSLQLRTTPPTFPNDPPSCPKCASNFPSINTCAQAAPILANFTMVIFNPGAFIDVIKCACTDTFQSAFPQCVDCFTLTNQTDVLDTPDLPAAVNGVREVCALASTLLGGVASANSEAPSSTVPQPSPTSVTSGALVQRLAFGQLTLLGLGLIVVSLLL